MTADDVLLRCALTTLSRRQTTADRGVPLWSVVRDLFCIGSTSSIELCQRFDIDPHQAVSELAYDNDPSLDSYHAPKSYAMFMTGDGTGRFRTNGGDKLLLTNKQLKEERAGLVYSVVVTAMEGK